MDCRQVVQFVLQGSSHLEEYAILLVRVLLGLFFAISGAKELFFADRTRTMYETLIAAKVPFPRLMTYFVSGVEFIGGLLLVTGLDGLQDTFFRAYRSLGSFEGRARFSSWLTRIAINSALMILRRRRARPETSSEPLLDLGEDSPYFDVRDFTMNPEQVCD